MNSTPRRADRIIEKSEALSILETAEYGTLALHSNDDYPYCLPINFVKSGDVLYMHCALEGKKLDCIKKSDKAMFCAVGKIEVDAPKFSLNYTSIMAFGKIEVCTDAKERIYALNLLVARFTPNLKEAGASFIEKLESRTKVLKFTIKAVSGKGRKAAH